MAFLEEICSKVGSKALVLALLPMFGLRHNDNTNENNNNNINKSPSVSWSSCIPQTLPFPPYPGGNAQSDKGRVL